MYTILIIYMFVYYLVQTSNSFLPIQYTIYIYSFTPSSRCFTFISTFFSYGKYQTEWFPVRSLRYLHCIPIELAHNQITERSPKPNFRNTIGKNFRIESRKLSRIFKQQSTNNLNLWKFSKFPALRKCTREHYIFCTIVDYELSCS